MRTALSALLAVIFAASAIAVSPAATEASGHKIALGVAITQDRSITVVDDFSASVGRAPAMWSIWSNWGETATRDFPNQTFLNQLDTRGITPVIWWQPANPADLHDPSFRYQRILDGVHDEYLRQWAQQAKAWGKTVIIRLAHEMNGRWFPWGVTRFDNTPARFVAAWRHMWNVIKGPGGEGASNVKFLWSPYGLPCKSPSCTATYEEIFPGDSYVDYVGFSRFNWGGSAWTGLYGMFDNSMVKLLALSNKPIIAAEIASAPGEKKAQWITNGYPKVYNAWPRLVGIIYFNHDMRPHNQPDWRIRDHREEGMSPPPAQEAYKSIAADARFQGSLAGNPPVEPPAPNPQAPSATLMSNAKMTSKGQIWLRVSWPAVAGAVEYQLQQRINTKAWTNIPLSSATALSVSRAVKPGRNVTWRLRARTGSTWSSWAQGPTMPLVAFQEQDVALTYSGAFTRASVSGAFGGYVRHTNVGGRKVTMTFTGRSISFVTARGPGRGIAEILLDGNPVTVDLYQSALNSRFVAWTADVGPGTHTIEVRVTGTKRSAAKNTRIDIDAFVVLR